MISIQKIFGYLPFVKVLSLLFLALILTTSCRYDRQKRPSFVEALKPKTSVKKWDNSPFGPTRTEAYLRTMLQKSLQGLRPGAETVVLAADVHRALSFCHCAFPFQEKLMLRFLKNKGVLPAILIPQVQKEIIANPLIEMSLQIGDATAQSFLLKLANSFLDADTLSEQVRSNIDTKIRFSLGGVLPAASPSPGADAVLSPLRKRLDYDFQLFAPLNASEKEVFSSFLTSEQSIKWLQISRWPWLWRDAKDQASLEQKELQLLASVITMAEWSYLFGLDAATNRRNKVYGGLSINPLLGIGAPLTSFDARKSTSWGGIISGEYTMSFNVDSKSDTLTSALTLEETWARSNTPFTLAEQADIWLAAAEMYKNFKPSTRIHPAMFQPTKGIFPPEVHQLGLNFLPGMATLLDGLFIDTDARLIYTAAKIEGASPPPLAGLMDLTRLARALGTWLEVTTDIERDDLSPNVKKTLSDSLPKLKDALRLAIRNILSGHVLTQDPNPPLAGFTKLSVNKAAPSLAEVAEVLATLSYIEAIIFKSEGTELREKMWGLYEWMVAHYFATEVSLSPLDASPQTWLWLHISLDQLARFHKDYTASSKWYADLFRLTQSEVTRLDVL